MDSAGLKEHIEAVEDQDRHSRTQQQSGPDVRGRNWSWSRENMLRRKNGQRSPHEDALRSSLSKLGLVAFVGNGAVLPRKSGVDDRPMTTKDSPNLATWQNPREDFDIL